MWALAPVSSGEDILKTDAKPLLAIKQSGKSLVLSANGYWTSANADDLEDAITSALNSADDASDVLIDMETVLEVDTYGAWALVRMQREFTEKNISVQIADLSDEYIRLYQQLDIANKSNARPEKKPFNPVDYLELIGRSVKGFGVDFLAFINLLGALSQSLFRAILNPLNFRFTSMVHQLDRVCFQAVPIILLITFLIGAIIAQQGLFHFSRFGAELYVVDMVGILVLREIGILLVAIMIAGRSGSSYTAELGSMKMREEIDALRTMGVNPVDALILPRILVLVLAVPMLAFLGCMAALYGGGLVAWAYGGMSPEIFITRLKEAISMDHFLVGMIKAPFMGLVIGVVACTEGMRVKGSAESLGLQTTMSVVKAIFMVIVLDGLFAIFFSSIGI